MGIRDRQLMVAEDDPGFVRFWNAYAKRRSKKDARIAWAQVNPSPALIERIVDALQWQFQQPDWLKEGCQYAPLPATYLRQERWTDEPPAQVQRVMSDGAALVFNVLGVKP